MSDLSVGIDLGGTKIFGALVDPDLGSGLDTVVSDAKAATPTAGVDAVIDAIVAVVGSLSEAPSRVGVGTPGVVDPATGTVLRAPNLAGFDEPVALGPRLAERLGCPVVIGNDVNVAALGEVRAGAAVGATDVLAVWMGTGLGAALVLDGALRIGPNGLAGELGHAVVVPGGRPCGCGGRGHLEAYIGRRGLEQAARARHDAGEDTILVERAADGRMKSKVFRAAWDAEDAMAIELLTEGLDMLAIAVGNVAVTVDVSTVVLGGGLGERFSDVAIEHLDAALTRSSFAGTTPAVVAAVLGDHAGALGAAHLARDAS